MTSTDPHRVLVDTDGGLDDALALVYLAQHPHAELVAAGSVHGNVAAPAAANNTLRVLELAGDTSTPVAVGATQPLAQNLHLGHPEDPFGTLAGSPHRTPSPETADEQLVRLARQYPGELSLLALGPLTNLAAALDTEPQLPDLLRTVVVMGGVLHTDGNITAYAESNVWHDPDTAETVLAAGFSLTLAALDVTRDAVATPEWLRAVATDTTSLWGQYAAYLLHQHGDTVPRLPLHDPLAAALLLTPSLGEYETLSLYVDLSRTDHRGQLLLASDTARPPVCVASSVLTDVFRTELLQVIAPGAAGGPSDRLCKSVV